jgi:hypothetical protein
MKSNFAHIITVIIITLQLCILHECYAQRLYYGIPSDKSQLKVGDVVVINTPPSYFSGKFMPSEQMDSLVNFLKGIDFETCIYVNEFILSDDRNWAYSDLVCEGLKYQLEKSQISNCTVLSVANQIPMINDAFITTYFPLSSIVEIKAILSRLDIVLTSKKGEPSNCKAN